MDYYAIGEDKSLKNVLEVEEWEKLWENPNPSTINFVAQTITLSKNLSQGDEIAITTGSGAIFMGKLTMPNGNSLNLIDIEMQTVPGGNLSIYTRSADYGVGNNTMAFSDCYLNILKRNGDHWPQTPIRDCVKKDGNLIPIAVYKRKSQVFN